MIDVTIIQKHEDKIKTSFNSAGSISSQLESHLSLFILLGSVTLFSHPLTAFDHFSRPLNQKHYFQFLVCSSKKQQRINYNKGNWDKWGKGKWGETSFSMQIFVVDVSKIFIINLVVNLK